MSGISKRVSGSWVSGDYGIMKTATDTITTLPADLYPNDTTATVGLKGNMSQTGTPSPDNPIQPSECGDRTGNLFDKENTGLYFYNTSLGQGNKWITSTSGVVIRISCSPSTQYTLSLSGEYSQTVWNIELTNTDSTPSAGNNVTTTAITNTKPPSLITTFTTLSDTKYILVQLSQAYISTGGASNIMLNSGSTALPYEPYGYKIPISSGGVTTNIYLGSTQTVRAIKKVVFDGSEDWQGTDDTVSKYLFIWNYDYKVESGVTCMSTHYSGANNIVSGDNIPNNSACFYKGDSQRVLYLKGSEPITLADFKAYLAQQYANGTPVTVWYVLATPTTGMVNEPIRKIGDYADTVSGITIPTTAGANSFDVLTTLKPSEVTVNYKGWHPVADVHERENGAWT